MAETAMPTWDVYAIDLARRLADHGASPTTIVVGILAYVVENEGVGVDEHERAMAKAWLDRLVDEEGNPKDDKGRNALVWAFEENTLSHHGSLTAILPEDDRVTLEMVVSRRAASLDRANLRAQLVPHAESYVDHLLDELYGEKPEA